MYEETNLEGKKTPDDHLDEAEFELEKWKVREELKLRREELEIKRAEAAKTVWSSPLVLAVVGLVATVLVSVIQNAYQSNANRDLEQRKFESALIEKALETDDQLIAAHRLKRLLDLHLITDRDGTIASWLNDPTTIPVDIAGESFLGDSRRVAKLSIGSGKVESFSDLSGLVASLPPVDVMLSQSPPIADDPRSQRVAEEQRNVHLRAFLYAASREADNDFHLIIGEGPKAGRVLYMTAEVSGLPPSTSLAFEKLFAARKSFEDFFGKESLPGAGYHFYQPAIPVELEGSLFFDLDGVSRRLGPSSLSKQMPTPWEIHPVTSIKWGE